MIPLTPLGIAASYQLRAPEGGPFTNVRGSGEKYFRGVTLSEDNAGWYFILPDGSLFAFSYIGGIVGSTYLTRLDTDYYAYPLSLADACLPAGLITDFATLQAQYGLRRASSGLHTNLRGWGESYLVDAAGNWFFVLPTGTVFKFVGTLETSIPLATGMSISSFP